MKRKPPAQRNIDIDLDTCRLQLRLSARTGARMLSQHLWEFEPAAGEFTVSFGHWVTFQVLSRSDFIQLLNDQDASCHSGFPQTHRIPVSMSICDRTKCITAIQSSFRKSEAIKKLSNYCILQKLNSGEMPEFSRLTNQTSPWTERGQER